MGRSRYWATVLTVGALFAALAAAVMWLYYGPRTAAVAAVAMLAVMVAAAAVGRRPVGSRSRVYGRRALTGLVLTAGLLLLLGVPGSQYEICGVAILANALGAALASAWVRRAADSRERDSSA